MASERRIDKCRYDKVLWYRVCPGCGDYTVIDVARRSKSDLMEKSRYLGSFHSCGGPEGHLCWHMSKFDANKPERPLYETFGPMAKKSEAA